MVNTNTIADFFAQFPVLNYEKGQIIIHAQDEPTGVFYLKSGFVKKTSILENGKVVTINIFKPTSFFPIIWAFTDAPNTYYYEAISPIEIYRAPKAAFLEFVKGNPKILLSVTKRVLKRMKRLQVNMEYQLSGNSYQKVVAALLFAAKRFGVKEELNGVTVNIPLTHQEIADLAGVTRETATLNIDKLIKAKIIKYQKRKLVINSSEKLNGELQVNQESV